MDAVDLRLVLRRDRRHDAVADGCGIAVMRLHEADAGAAAGRAPGDRALVFHEAADAELLGERIVEFRGTREIVRAKRDIPDHQLLPKRLIEIFVSYAALRFGWISLRLIKTSAI